jgi:hypothetical protein
MPAFSFEARQFDNDTYRISHAWHFDNLPAQAGLLARARPKFEGACVMSPSPLPLARSPTVRVASARGLVPVRPAAVRMHVRVGGHLRAELGDGDVEHTSDGGVAFPVSRDGERLQLGDATLENRDQILRGGAVEHHLTYVGDRALNAVYSRYVFEVVIERGALSSVFKAILPALFIVLGGFLALLLGPDKALQRLGINMGATSPSPSSS